MNFASVLSAQIAKSQKETPVDKKYIKRSEVEAQRQAAYLAEQKALEAARIERFERKRKADEEEELRAREREEKKRRLAEESRRRREEEEEAEERDRRKRLGLPVLESKTEDDGNSGDDSSNEKDIPDEQLDVKLRELEQPVKISGETHKQRVQRYYKLVNRSSPPIIFSDGPIPTKLKLVSEKRMKVAKGLPKNAEKRYFLSRQLVSYFNMVLKEWEIALSQRDDSVKASFQGKAAFNAMVQARENMRPLFRKLEKDELEDGILEPIIEIVNAAQERCYVDANDGYLRLSIGKALVIPQLFILNFRS